MNAPKNRGRKLRFAGWLTLLAIALLAWGHPARAQLEPRAGGGNWATFMSPTHDVRIYPRDLAFGRYFQTQMQNGIFFYSIHGLPGGVVQPSGWMVTITDEFYQWLGARAPRGAFNRIIAHSCYSAVDVVQPALYGQARPPIPSQIQRAAAATGIPTVGFGGPARMIGSNGTFWVTYARENAALAQFEAQLGEGIAFMAMPDGQVIAARASHLLEGTGLAQLPGVVEPEVAAAAAGETKAIASTLERYSRGRIRGAGAAPLTREQSRAQIFNAFGRSGSPSGGLAEARLGRLMGTGRGLAVLGLTMFVGWQVHEHVNEWTGQPWLAYTASVIAGAGFDAALAYVLGSGTFMAAFMPSLIVGAAIGLTYLGIVAGMWAVDVVRNNINRSREVNLSNRLLFGQPFAGEIANAGGTVRGEQRWEFSWSTGR